MRSEVKRLLVAAVAALAAFGADAARGWTWEMPGEVYKELDFTARAGVDRATKIFRQAQDAENRGTRVTDLVPRYRAAVAEWRKVQIQAEAENFDEDLVTYALFMQAYSRERAHDRHEAMKLYSEVVDLHPEVEWLVIPAKYRLADCHFALGENRKGHRAIDEFVDEKAHDGHCLMAHALNTQAWRLWREGKYEEAMEDWQRIIDDRYAANNPDVWNSTHDLFITLALVTGEFDHFEEMVYAGVKETDDKGRFERCRWAVDRAYYSVAHGWCGYYDRLRERYPNEKERQKRETEARKWFQGWFENQKPIYDKVGRGIDYLYVSLRVAFRFDSEDKQLKLLAKIRDYIRSEKKDDAVNARTREAINLVMDNGKPDWARPLPDLMKGVLAQCWTRYEIEARVQKWDAALKHLLEYIGHKPDADSLRRAKWTLADIYHHRVNQVEKAVKLYLELDDPPATLWALVDCYRRLGKKKDAYNLLDEIASIFEKEAPRAVYAAAGYREQDGEKAKAIALYKRLLSHPEWKKSGESSAAHQALERLGVATGGAMTNEVR